MREKERDQRQKREGNKSNFFLPRSKTRMRHSIFLSYSMLFGLLSQNTTDWMTYKTCTFISYSSGCLEIQTQGTVASLMAVHSPAGKDIRACSDSFYKCTDFIYKGYIAHVLIIFSENHIF